MKTIWKYPVVIDDIIELEIPRGAKFLTIQTQHGNPCIWCIVDPLAPKDKKKFRIYGTGHKIMDETNEYGYLGTFQISNGDSVFHLFEIK